MKKSLFFIAMMLVAFTAYAQDKKDQDPKEKFFQARVKEMVFRLKITDEQKPEFEKVYKAYTEAVRQAVGAQERPVQRREGVAQSPEGQSRKPGDRTQKDKNQKSSADQARPERKKLTKEEAVKLEKGKIERQQKLQEVKLQYIDEFAKVLETDQLVRLYAVENQIQQKLHSRQQGRGGQGMKGGRPNGPRPGNRHNGSGPEDGE